MKIIIGGNGNRGVSCLQALLDRGYEVDLVIAHPRQGKQWYASVSELATKQGIKVIEPENPNDKETESLLKSFDADVFVAAGYGKILKQNIIDTPRIMSINLHAGKLPEYRGSSPLNWALINGETSFTLTIIKLDAGVDTGDIILDKTFDIGINDTIRDLHRIANMEFPSMLVKVLDSIADGSYMLKPQNNLNASYYPLRFPEDGLVLWDIYTAQQIHNRVRALTEPYPCAFTFFDGRKVKLLSSELSDQSYFGEPGRVYQKTNKGLLVCASDRCLWIKEAVFGDNGKALHEAISRYDSLATVRSTIKANANREGNLV